MTSLALNNWAQSARVIQKSYSITKVLLRLWEKNTNGNNNNNCHMHKYKQNS